MLTPHTCTSQINIYQYNMFSKKRYTRKSRTTRRPFKARTRRARVLRPAEPAPKHEPRPELGKEDLVAAGAAIYPWMHVQPSLKTVAIRAPVISLRQTCARVVALNSASLSPSYLDEASWACWLLVWRYITELELDLPALFRMFWRRFGSHSTFFCHSKRSSLVSSRFEALRACLTPVRRHRIENIFSNVSVTDFAAFVSNCSASVVVDCSKITFSNLQLLSLCNIPTLVALDISGTLVDDQFLYTLCSCLVEKNVSLSVLRISRCPNVTKKGLLWVLEEAAHNLAYVETDVSVSPSTAFAQRLDSLKVQIPGTKWELLSESDPTTTNVAKYSLATKVHYLLRNNGLELPELMIWDFKFFPQVISTLDAESITTQYEESWVSRLKQATLRLIYTPYCYMRNHSLEIKFKVPPKEEKPRELFPRQGYPTVRKPVKKPRAIATSVKSFFGTI